MKFSYNRFRMKYQKYAIRNLSTYVSIVFAIGWLILQTIPQIYNVLLFAPKELLSGQIWRILTTLLYPPFTGNIFYVIIGIYVYYSMAQTLERYWGSFPFNLYFFGSLLVTELGITIFYLISGYNLPLIPVYMYFSVFMAYAITFPDATFLLFFLIPVKAKYLAIFEAAVYAYNFLTGGIVSRVYILCALIPVAVYFYLANGGGNPVARIRGYFDEKKRRREWRDQWK